MSNGNVQRRTPTHVSRLLEGQPRVAVGSRGCVYEGVHLGWWRHGVGE